MHPIRFLCLVIIALAIFALGTPHACAADAPESGAAIVIVFDSSGSMNNSVPNAEGNPEPKFKIATKAFREIVGKIEAYAHDHRVDAGMVTFEPGKGAKVAVPFGRWDKRPFEAWLSGFSNPNGGTPLGEALMDACRMLEKSNLKHKHVVALTDGEANGKLEPATAIKAAFKSKGAAAPQIHIVAFDVNATVFDPVKKAGADILPANNGKALAAGLDSLFSGKILLEEEE